METAPDLQDACEALLPAYARARREPERWAVLTRACLQRRPVERSGELGPAAAERFDRIALQLMLEPDVDPGSLLITDVERASDVLCALWLARRCGLFSPGSACGDAVGRRSACEIVPAFASGVSVERRESVWEVLHANTAWQAHRAARSVAVAV